MNAKLVSWKLNLIFEKIFLWLDSASDDINQRVQAMFACPKRLRPKMRKVESAVAKRSIEENENNGDELNDFYLF